ncbi:hypothetical protein MLD38_018783 [Melastoma candidum]|uniref:Uncharacterized protein n=1 Tax=Melastoma candidum TaxID=119954 RepID=A0ACB9QYD6_9MYRT|nr:hypothetical protein MLD38_018783 [Melastoma candidum]
MHPSERLPSKAALALPPCGCPHLEYPSPSPCPACVADLILSAASSPPRALTVHVSHALSLLLRFPLLPHAPQLLVQPLLHALSSLDDGPIASQVVEILLLFCGSSSSCSSERVEPIVHEVAAGLSELVSLPAFGWSKSHVHVLNLLGMLLKSFGFDAYQSIVSVDALVCNLTSALQLSSSEEIRGEVLFVLYKLYCLQTLHGDLKGTDIFNTFGPKLVRSTLDILMKTQNDDVRLNCVVSTQRGLLRDVEVDEMCIWDGLIVTGCDETSEDLDDDTPLCSLFCEAIKGPLLSSNNDVQISALDLLFHYLSYPGRKVQLLVEENLADYTFEILRLSGCKDPVVSSCLRVLSLLSEAGVVFQQRLAVGFPTLIRVLNYVSQVPFHPGQCQILMLILDCVSYFPGVSSASQIAELVMILAQMLRRHRDEVILFDEAFGMVCSIYVTIMRTPLLQDIKDLTTALVEAVKDVVLASLSFSGDNGSLLLHSLCLLIEVFSLGRHDECNNKELHCSVVDACRKWILPWLLTSAIDMEREDIMLGVLEAFHTLLIVGDESEVFEFAETLLSVSWFSFSFRCLGNYPAERMKSRVYLIISALADIILVLQILYLSSLYDDRLAPEGVILASVEQYILVNSSDLVCTASASAIIPVVALYSLYRGLSEKKCPSSYSGEAERHFMEMVGNADLELTSVRIHHKALKWLFQQEILYLWLSNQIRNFCKVSELGNAQIQAKNDRVLDLLVSAQLVAAEDTLAAKVFVFLLEDLLSKKGNELELTSIFSLLQNILRILPAAAEQLCLNGIGKAVCVLFCECYTIYSLEAFTCVSIFIWNLLLSVHSESLADDDIWSAVTMKLIYQLINTGKIRSSSLDNIIIGVLCMILHHSTNGAFIESAKTILLNPSLATSLMNTVQTYCSNGPAMLDLIETTNAGETLLNVLLLQYYALKSVRSVLPGIMVCQNMREQSDSIHSVPSSISCHGLCRMIHFGSPMVKLISSHILVEILTMFEQNRGMIKDFKCTGFMSLGTVLEGQVFSGDARVAVNCGRSLSVLIDCSHSDIQLQKIIEKNPWSRLIVEELALSLVTPSVVPISRVKHYKAAIYVAVALLRSQRTAEWMKSVFDSTCISGFLEHLSSSNMSIEIVLLLTELRSSCFLNVEQVATINRLFQECRKLAYDESATSRVEYPKKLLSDNYTAGTISNFLCCLISAESPLSDDSVGTRHYKKRLLDEIEIFFKAPSLVAADAG